MVVKIGLTVAILFICTVSAYAQPVWLQRVEDESAVVMWVSQSKDPEVVTYVCHHKETKKSQSRVSVLKPTIAGDTSANVHEADLVGLCADTRYTYRIGNGVERELVTAKKTSTWRFAFTSNPNALSPSKAKQTWQAIAKVSPNFVVISGDISNKSTNADYLQFVTRTQPLISQVPVYTVQGNHDNRNYTTYDAWFNNETQDRHTERFYAFDKGPVRFIMINDMAARADMFPTAWFKAAIARGGAKWVAVVANGNWRKHQYMQQQLNANRADIDVLLTSGSGAQRVDGKQLVVESGGANYVHHVIDVSEGKITATGYNADGSKRGDASITRQVGESHKPMPPMNITVQKVD